MNWKIKHDVYLKVIDTKTFTSVTSGKAYTRSFNNDQLSEDGKFEGQQLNFRIEAEREVLSSLDFSRSTEGNKQIHTIVINKDEFEKSDQEEQALIIQHEIESHITPLIGNEQNVYEDQTNSQHEKFHGFNSRTSPSLGKEMPGTPQAEFNKQMKESVFNKKNEKK